jgi:hypothetical protein
MRRRNKKVPLQYCKGSNPKNRDLQSLKVTEKPPKLLLKPYDGNSENKSLKMFDKVSRLFNLHRMIEYFSDEVDFEAIIDSMTQIF